ncbi:hypothetical protein GC177_01150 [bacterium]|nr:hypothetical protein [bacterium]
MRRNKHTALQRLPILLIAGWLLLAWPIGGLVKLYENAANTDLNPPLHGQYAKKQLLPFNKKNFLNGSFQRSFEAWLPRRLPLSGLMVRATNQVYYSLLNHSAMGGDNPIAIGKDGYLYTASYLISYCNTRRIQPDLEALNKRNVQLKRIQDWLKSRGKYFIYVVSPSKAAYFPEYIPDEYGCVEGQTRPAYYAGIKSAKIAGLNLVDNSERILREKGESVTPLFPKGGIHYNQEGTVIATNAMLEEIGRLMKKPIAPIQYKINPSQDAKGNDVDILNLLNLLWPDYHYTVADLVVTDKPKTVRIPVAFIGGSFVIQPIQLLDRLEIFPVIYHYSYYKLAKITYPGQQVSQLPQEHGHDYDDIFNAKVIILEENEEIIPSNHADAFIAEALSRMENHAK